MFKSSGKSKNKGESFWNDSVVYVAELGILGTYKDVLNSYLYDFLNVLKVKRQEYERSKEN